MIAVSIPSDNNSLENAANVVVVRKGDKEHIEKGDCPRIFSTACK